MCIHRGMVITIMEAMHPILYLITLGLIYSNVYIKDWKVLHPTINGGR